MLSLDSITFDTTGLIPQGDKNGVRVWQTPGGDGVGLCHFPIPPDIVADINSLSSVRSYYGDLISAANSTGILIDTSEIDEFKVVKLIVRVPQQHSGISYIGSLTLPFRDFSFVDKMQCTERGMTRMRESIVMDELLGSGKVKIGKSGRIEGWEKSLDSAASPTWKINEA